MIDETTMAALRHRPAGKGEEPTAAAAADCSSKVLAGNGSSMRLEPLPRSPPTAGGKRLDGLGKEREEEEDAMTPSTAETTPVSSPPPPSAATATTTAASGSRSASFGDGSRLLALSRAFSSYPGEVIHMPETGPAKVDMADPPPHPLAQVLDFLILFLIVRTA